MGCRHQADLELARLLRLARLLEHRQGVRRDDPERGRARLERPDLIDVRRLQRGRAQDLLRPSASVAQVTTFSAALPGALKAGFRSLSKSEPFRWAKTRLVKLSIEKGSCWPQPS